MKKECAIYNISNVIGKKWTLLILLELYKGNYKWKRFSELKYKLKYITQKMLSLRLKELEKEKLLEKKIDNSRVPIKCEYKLTKSGKDFISIIKQMKKWALKCGKASETCNIQECKMCGV